MAYQRRFQKILRPVPKNCPFCKTDSDPVYSDVETLTRYLSERGKILSHLRTGLCSTHQRRITRAIKHARSIALVPFVNRI